MLYLPISRQWGEEKWDGDMRGRDRERERMWVPSQCTEDTFGSWMGLLRFAQTVTVSAFRARGVKGKGEQKPLHSPWNPSSSLSRPSHVLDSMHLFSAGFEPEPGSWNCCRRNVSKGKCCAGWMQIWLLYKGQFRISQFYVKSPKI